MQSRIDPTTQRPRMDEALGVIMRLLAGEVVDHASEWFELRQARLQLLPYTRPHFPIAVASQISPAGMVTAGHYGVGVLSLGAGLPGGKAALPGHWAIAEEAAAKAGQTVRRADWRLVIGVYIADSRDEAIRDVAAGRYRETTEYFENTLGRPHVDMSLEQIIANDGAIIGSPDDAIAAIERLQEASGGFGGLLAVANEWTTREQTLRSYELFARYVMPRFQNVLPPLEASNQWVAANRRAIFAPSLTAIANAFTEAGREIPPELARRIHRLQ